MLRGKAVLQRAALVCLAYCTGLLCLEFYRQLRDAGGWEQGWRPSGPIVTTADLAAQTPCARQILADFGATAAASNRSAPVYIRPPQPMPIGAACGWLFANWTASARANVSQLNAVAAEKQHMMASVLHQIVTNFSQRNLEIYMSDGSLLGSARHFNFIEWDADLDVTILARQMPQVRRLLIELSASDQFNFTDSLANGHWQMGILCEAKRSRPSWRRLYGGYRLYPEKSCHSQIDFFLARVVGRHRRRPEPPQSLLAADVYPLRLRPFGPYLIPAPNRPENVLAVGYGADYRVKCVIKYLQSKTVACSSMHSRYSFVATIACSELPGKRLEVLVNGTNLLALFVPSQ